jgi:ribosome biogenesis GTPase / thiamine phosphate phosphatase
LSVPSLADLGWTPARERAFAPLAASGLVPGRVVLEHNHVFRVLTALGEVLAESAGRMKHRAEGRQALPVVGDWVAVRPDRSGGRAQIREVLPRTSGFSRKAAGREGRETEEQVVAANIDIVLVVFGLDLPVNTNAIERYLVVARASGATPEVILNKSDLCGDVAEALAVAGAAAGDVPVTSCSTRSGDGLAGLEHRLASGVTMALLGPSGAGKSSIVNRLVGREVLATGEVRPWDARGRHTSVHRQLVVRDGGGLVIDTPGMRELQLWDTEGVSDAFTDIAQLAAGCRFRDCQHDREPGCAVKVAVEAGELEAPRYASFLKLQQEQRVVARLRDERAQADAKRGEKIQQKSLKALQRDRQRQGRDS